MTHDPQDDLNPRGLAALPVPGQSSLHSPHAAPLPAPSQSAAPPQPDEPFGMLDLEEPVERYHVEEAAVLPRDPWTLFVHWEVTESGWNAARATLGGGGKLTLRIYSVSSQAREGVVSETADHPLDWDHGRRYVPAPRPGAHVSAAVGLVAPDGRFAPICHAPRVRVPQAEPADGAVEWMEVAATRSRGARREPPEIVRRGPGLAGGAPGFTEGFWQRGAPTSPAAGEAPSSPWRWQSGGDKPTPERSTTEKRDGR